MTPLERPAAADKAHGGHISAETRVNERIRSPEVRLVGPKGEQIGIVSITEALRLAQEAGLDLVEVAPTARPPVCKLMDYGKFKYESAVKAAAAAAEEVAAAARRRAAALAAGDEAALRLLMHPDLQWTTLRGEVLGYEDYITGNTRGSLRWRAQRLEGIKVAVAGSTAVLTAAVTDEVSRDGRDQVFQLRVTLTWVRTPQGWRCLAGHASPPVP
jgi:ketosteroid isomerase-like protein